MTTAHASPGKNRGLSPSYDPLENLRSAQENLRTEFSHFIQQKKPVPSHWKSDRLEEFLGRLCLCAFFPTPQSPLDLLPAHTQLSEELASSVLSYWDALHHLSSDTPIELLLGASKSSLSSSSRGLSLWLHGFLDAFPCSKGKTLLRGRQQQLDYSQPTSPFLIQLTLQELQKIWSDLHAAYLKNPKWQEIREF